MFRRTYWYGGFDGDVWILGNRLALRNELKLKSWRSGPSFTYTTADNIDHTEFYRCEDGSVCLVMHPYAQTHESLTKMLSLGMKWYRPCYNAAAVTYYQIAPDMRQLKKLLAPVGFMFP